ncbi:MAG TPA: AmmeMemoRadiSam system protein B [Candidatus Saccharimonadales bacterium]|nr:AmmeMemoRadiSam system protein B [Candidatus Saccharimonadales bacterium]
MNYFFKIHILIILTFFSGTLFAKTYKNHLSDSWYPVKEKLLSKKLQDLQIIAQKEYPMSLNPSLIKAFICPHAGYDYSGAVACSAYQLLHPGIFKRIMILAPYHQNDFSGVALPGAEYDEYQNILGSVNLDTSIIKKLKKSSPLFVHNQQAHDHEHAIEIQIPFIQRYCGKCKIIPLLIGSVTDDDIKNIAQILQSFLDEKTLLIVSSDFTHYGKQFGYEPFKHFITQSIFELDSSLVEKIQEFDLSGFSQLLHTTQATVCGKSAIMILLHLLQQKAFEDTSRREISRRDASRREISHGETSRGETSRGETSQGEPSRGEPSRGDKSHRDITSYVIGYNTSASDKKNPAHSVSYASIVFTQQQRSDLPLQDQLTGYEKNLLLKLARHELQRVVMPDENSLEIPGMLTQSLKKAQGAFVTLYEDKKLRGCIGSVTSSQPLYQVVIDMTRAAALHDTRFSPVQSSELPNIDIAISVLTQPHTIRSYKDIILGTDGIILKHENHQAVYLPHVASEQGWNLEQTLSSLSEKAGLDKNGWKDNQTKFDVFQAIEIGHKV